MEPELATDTSELPGIPERDEVGQCAIEFVNLRKQFSVVQKAMNEKGAQLLMLLKQRDDKSLALQDGDGNDYVIFVDTQEKISCQKGGKKNKAGKSQAVLNP